MLHDENPYSAPREQAERSDPAASETRWRKIRVASTIIAVGSPLLGLSGTVFYMVLAFESLAEQATVAPERLADLTSRALLSTAVLIPFMILGVVLRGVANRRLEQLRSVSTETSNAGTRME